MRIEGVNVEVVKGQGYVSSVGRRNKIVSGKIKPVRGSATELEFNFPDKDKYEQLGFGTKVYFYEAKRPDPGKLRKALDVDIYGR